MDLRATLLLTQDDVKRGIQAAPGPDTDFLIDALRRHLYRCEIGFGIKSRVVNVMLAGATAS